MSARASLIVSRANLAVPNPQPDAPPGSESVTQILNWVFWIASAAGVLGFIAVGVMMMLSHRQGRGDDHMSRLGYVLGGCILVAAASGLAGALL